jgi:L-glutamine-phosphate cytidylyltransferase
MPSFQIVALILAAGRGSRMGHFTKNQPKCLISLAGKSLFEWQREALMQSGINKIWIIGGYLINSLIEKGYPCIYNPKWQESNIVESLNCGDQILRRYETVISYGDIVYNSKIIKSLLESPYDITITYDIYWRLLWKERFIHPLKDAETFQIDKGFITEIGHRPTNFNQIQGQYMGLLKLTPKGWMQIQSFLNKLSIDERMSLDMTTLLQNLIGKKVKIHGIAVSGKWCEMDTSSDLKLYKQKLKSRGWSHDWRD